MLALSRGPGQSTAAFTRPPRGVTRQESSGITGKLCFSSQSSEPQQQRVPVRRKSLPQAGRGGGGDSPPHGCSGEFPLTALFSASGEEENSQHNTGSTNLKTGHGLRTDNVRWVPGGTPGQQSKSQEDASSRGPLQHVKFKAIISLFLFFKAKLEVNFYSLS